MTNSQADKPSVEGLMALVSEYGQQRWSEGASGATYIDRRGERQSREEAAESYAELRAYAERLASQSAAVPPIAPVAWMVFTDGEYDYKVFANAHEAEAEAAETEREPVPIYAAPPSAVLLEVLDVLRWYGMEADALARNLTDKKVVAVTASAQVLGLDAGNRASRAIAKLREWMGERG